MNEVVDPETGEVSAIVPAPQQSIALFGSDDPEKAMDRMTRVAAVLAAAIRKQGLTNNIQGKEYVRVEGWTMLGSLLGVFPSEVTCEPLSDSATPAGHDWRSSVTVRGPGGNAVGSAVALCCRSEKRWATADEYAVASMAQTRATAKALRLPLGFVMKLAGYEATPAEEMPTAPKDGPQASAQTTGAGAEVAQGRAAPRPAPTVEGRTAIPERPQLPVGEVYHACPKCGGKTVRLNQHGGAYCWAKAGGCAARWDEEQWSRRNAPPLVTTSRDSEEPPPITDENLPF